MPIKPDTTHLDEERGQAGGHHVGGRPARWGPILGLTPRKSDSGAIDTTIGSWGLKDPARPTRSSPRCRTARSENRTGLPGRTIEVTDRAEPVPRTRGRSRLNPSRSSYREPSPWWHSPAIAVKAGRA